MTHPTTSSTGMALPRALYLDLIQIQSTPYASANRDRNGSPKSALYGATLRARLSSQHQRHHERQAVQELLGLQAYRTRATTLEAVKDLTGRGWDPQEALTAVQMLILASAVKGLSIADNGGTNALLFLPPAAITELADLAHQHRDNFAPHITAAHTALAKETKKKTATAGDATDAADSDGEVAEDTDRTKALAAEVKKITAKNGFLTKEHVLRILRTRNAIVAAYGRMLANEPGSTVESAIQTAHALSTHAITTQIDSFTAVDNIIKELGEASGAGYLGEQRYNSATFYRYSTVNVTKLLDNLAGPKPAAQATARDTIEAFLRASCAPRNVGKVSGTAPHTLPHLMYAAVRTDQPVNLVGAFEEPVPATATGGYLTASMARLDAHAGATHRFLGRSRLAGHAHLTLADDQTFTHLGDRLDSLDEFVATTLATLDKAQG
ncbi:type I-E CRISPR-associated protein Cas7/Cse4/CasC [Streptomyces sp. NPDC101132]|uniref:type I-E CRISPR-associated protein Cas7/Cse4/CasC n=1 Tax=Streptomyces sp. NPDC101132 TaxID=3366110 RepID=UPI0038293BCB